MRFLKKRVIFSNLFLHYTFGKWMRIHYPNIPFERYADDTICYCVSKAQAENLKEVLTRRFEQCRLKLNAEKTKIVQCLTSTRKKVEGSEASFDFLGYTFQCRKSWNRKQGQCFTNFLPAISKNIDRMELGMADVVVFKKKKIEKKVAE